MKYLPDYSSRFRILKGGKISMVVSALIAGSTMSFGAPTGGVVSSGSAVIRQFGSTTNIDQSSQRAVINWNSFSIGASETVNFNQPNKSSVILNRVVGNETSVISGALNANGQVWILNSNGVLFNQSASINTAGLVASTMNITDQNFMNGIHTFESTGSTASVINMGTIQVADSSYVALMGKNVSNTGYIKATKGTISLSSGDKITLNFNGDSLVGVTIDQGTLDALVENKGAIIADGGTVLLTTKAANDLLNGVVNNTGVIQAKTLDDITGKIELFAHGGTATVSGTLDASAPDTGDGGFIETSGEIVNIAEETAITTASANGVGGTWLIDPINVTIYSLLTDLGGSFDVNNVWTPSATGSRVKSSTIESALNTGTNVTITTTGALAEAGNIIVNGAITKSAGTAATLTLKADNSITIQQNITSTSGALNLVLNHGSAGTASATINQGYGVSLNGGTLDVQKAGVTSTGTLNSTGTITNATLKAAIFNESGSTDKVSNVIFGSNMALTGTTKVEGDLVLTNGTTLTLGGSRYINFISPIARISTTTGTATIVIPQGNGINRNADGQVLTIDSGITINGAPNIYNQSFRNGSLINNGTINFSTGTGGIQYGSFINNGTLSMSSAGIQNLQISPATFTNSSTGIVNLNAASGWILLNATNWSNAGSINISNGGLVLGGNFTTAGIGTITRIVNAGATGGTVSLSGVLDNTSAVLDIGSSTFGTGGLSSLTSLQFATNRGTILGGTIVSNDGTTLKSTSGPATLNGVTIGGNLTFANSVYIANDLTLSNGVTLNLGANSLFFNTATTNITTPGSATIAMVGTTASGLIRAVSDQSLTIGSGVTINGKGSIKNLSTAILNGSLTNNGTINATTGTITISNGTFTNNGTMTANTGATLTVSPTTFTNAGTANVSGGTLNLSATNWSNTGTLNVSSGILNLDGGLTTAGIGAITRTGGSVNITGTLDNTGSTLDIGSATFGTGGLTNNYGTILNGTLISSDGTLLNGTTSSNQLSGVTIGSNLTLGTNAYIRNDLTLADGVVFSSGNYAIYFMNNTENIQLASGATSATVVRPVGNRFYSASNGTVIIGNGVTVQGLGSFDSNGGTSSWVNNGTIISQGITIGSSGTVNFVNNGIVSVPSGTFSMSQVNSFTNGSTGVVNISGGTVTTGGTWNNAGTFNFSSGTLSLGGNFSVANVGTINRSAGTTLNITGTLNNTGNILDLDSPQFGLGGVVLRGKIQGGTIIGTTLKTVSGRLDDVTIGSNLTFSGNYLYVDNDLYLANGINLNLGSSSVIFTNAAANIALGAGATSATVVWPWSSNMGSSASTLSIGNGITVDWSWNNAGLGTNGNIINNGTIVVAGAGYGSYSNDSFINNGMISVRSGSEYRINSTTFANNGTIEVANGAKFTRTTGFTNTGTLSGRGTIQVGTGTAKLTNQGIINVGATGSTGILSVSGDLLLDAGSNLNVEAAGTSAGQYDILAVSGAVTLGGTLNSSLIGGYSPVDADAIGFVTAGTSSGTFATSNLPSDFSLAYAQSAGEAARLTYTAPVVVTPPVVSILAPRFTSTTTPADPVVLTQQEAAAATESITEVTTQLQSTMTTTIVNPTTQQSFEAIAAQTPDSSWTGSIGAEVALNNIEIVTNAGGDEIIAESDQPMAANGSKETLEAQEVVVSDSKESSKAKEATVVRFPLGKNTFVSLYEGGIRLPYGVQQDFKIANNTIANSKDSIKIGPK